jgi:hypothetical protein
MTEQFDLSKHIVELEEGLAIHPDFVKEFIRELKSYFKIFFNDRNWKNHEYAIDKLAGKELIEDTQLKQEKGK